MRVQERGQNGHVEQGRSISTGKRGTEIRDGNATEIKEREGNGAGHEETAEHEGAEDT